MGLWPGLASWAAGNLDRVLGMHWGQGLPARGTRGTSGVPWVRPGLPLFPGPLPPLVSGCAGNFGRGIWGEAQEEVFPVV